MSSTDFAGLGLAPGVVHGTRSFNVDKYGRLTGVTYQQVWTPGENAAICRRTDNGLSWLISASALAAGGPLSTPPRPNTMSAAVRRMMGYYETAQEDKSETTPGPPHSFEDCACGFYGYFEGSDDFHDEKRISAVVEAYGETVIGTRGFRAMKARIVALVVSDGVDGVTASMARKVRRNYPEVAFFDSFDDMIREFPPDTSLEPSPENDPDFWTRDAL